MPLKRRPSRISRGMKQHIVQMKAWAQTARRFEPPAVPVYSTEDGR
jgi:hypothetical protein